jgi:hypothetical protein
MVRISLLPLQLPLEEGESLLWPPSSSRRD